MFERSLVISQQSHASAGQRWTALASITVQVGLAAVLIALPLLHPEGIPFRDDAPHALLPKLRVPKVKPVTVERTAATALSSIPTIPVQGSSLLPPRIIPKDIAKDDGAAPVQSFTGMGDPSGVPEVIASVGNGPARVVTVAPARARSGPLNISSGVSAGLLMAPIRPVYPVIAKAARVEGTVVVEAVISKGGLIERLRVVSGPEMLRASAMEAIRAARYQPFKLNGEPTEVQTTITVNFKLQS
ncbi:energy transducer TonB [Granulicella sp. dw_53]|uniref:energy transducer TonB n=1 Tax=Granulicella sp. dw_53 TaxID=2719792 RepID=UPI001BD685AE|nr:energy transducer TonB [Granulicella sp. dw_53]